MPTIIQGRPYLLFNRSSGPDCTEEWKSSRKWILADFAIAPIKVNWGGRKTTNAASNGRCGVIVCTTQCMQWTSASFSMLCTTLTILVSLLFVYNWTQQFHGKPSYIDFVSFFDVFVMRTSSCTQIHIPKYSLPNKRLRTAFCFSLQDLTGYTMQ